MQRHWQKAPLLVRQAVPGIHAPVTRSEMFALAASEEVESRLVLRHGAKRWELRHGPMPRRALPPLKQAGWTLLVQGLDHHCAAAAQIIQRFAFVPHARLDDLMLSYASDGGGVGPHLDSYDVFLLQVHGRRRWRISPPGDASLLPGLPMKILRRFQPTQEWVLEPGDMLYLPPLWGHDGTAVGADCMTASIGFRAPKRTELAAELFQRMAEVLQEQEDDTLYGDPDQAAAAHPGAMPAALQTYALQVVQRAAADSGAVAQALGEWLSEPKPMVTFEAGAPWRPQQGLAVHARTRMLYDDEQLYVNGEAFRMAGADAALLRRLADERRLPASECKRFTRQAQAGISEWAQAGWVVPWL